MVCVRFLFATRIFARHNAFVKCCQAKRFSKGKAKLEKFARLKCRKNYAAVLAWSFAPQ